jgi:hypothetical protein
MWVEGQGGGAFGGLNGNIIHHRGFAWRNGVQNKVGLQGPGNAFASIMRARKRMEKCKIIY